MLLVEQVNSVVGWVILAVGAVVFEVIILLAAAVQPLLLVIVTLYVPTLVTVLVALVVPSFHKYVPPPVAVSMMLLVEQVNSVVG